MGSASIRGGAIVYKIYKVSLIKIEFFLNKYYKQIDFIYIVLYPLKARFNVKYGTKKNTNYLE